MSILPEASPPRQIDAFVRCNQPGCSIVIGNSEYGAKKPRPCCVCARQIDREQHAARDRARSKGVFALEVPEPRSGLWPLG